MFVTGPDEAADLERDEEFDFFPLKPKFPHPFNGSIPTETFLNSAQGALRIYGTTVVKNLKTNHLNTGNIGIPNFLKFGFQMVRYSNRQSMTVYDWILGQYIKELDVFHL